MDSLARDGELGAAGDGDDFGDGQLGEDLLEGGFEDVFQRYCTRLWKVLRIFGVEEGPDFGGTAENPDAAEVDVAGGLDVGGLQVSEGDERVVVGVVVVPSKALGMDEDGGRGEGVVAVDEMSGVVSKFGRWLWEGSAYVR